MKRPELKFFLSAEYRDCLGYALAAVFFFYLIVFALAAPSPTLIGAVSFELVVYFGFLLFRLRRQAKKENNARQIVGAALVHYIPSGPRLLQFCSASVAGLGTFVLLCALVDALSFGFATTGNYEVAAFLYRRIPVSMLVGVNPGYTMELLSGAKVKAGKYSEVERMYRALYEIRSDIYGERSEKICNIYADFGDLAERRNDYAKAVGFYLRAINLSNEIKVPQGCGKFLTHLGQIEAEHGNIDAGLKHLQDALEMRSRIYGDRSDKVAETLVAIASVRSRLGDQTQAEQLSERASAIYRSLPKSDTNLAFYSALCTVFCMGFGYILAGRNGPATRCAVRKLEQMLEDGSVSQAKKDQYLEELNVLHSYVGGSKSAAERAETDHQITQHLGMFLTLTSQDLC